MSTPPPAPSSQNRAIALLALAGFASQAQVRAADSILPQIAADFGVTVGAASVVVSAYLIVHGTMQLVMGPVGDKFGKYRMIAIASALSAGFVFACGLTQTLPTLILARVAAAAAAAWTIPLGMAYIGDVVPYARRQQVLGRYLSGQITGQLFGQAAGGIIGDAFGWRAVFFVLAGLFAIAAVALLRELRVNPLTRPPSPSRASSGFAAGYRIVLGKRWARVVMIAVFLEGALMFGALAYVGADLHLRFGLNFTLVGIVIGTFGIGGLIYAAFVHQFVGRLGQIGLAAAGGSMLGVAYLLLFAAPVWWITPAAVILIGLGFYMLHNTLQTNATQMAPEARGTAVALFSSALYMGQPVGVAGFALVVDRYGVAPVFFIVGVLLPALGVWFALRLKARAE